MEIQENQDRELLNAMQRLSEYDLTLRLIKPLFLALGYERVEYYGGPDEEGKDVICWKADPIGDEELAVIQVKKYRPSRKAANKSSFSEIINQLTTAAEKELPNVNGIAYLPRDIYLITPFAIDTKVLKSRFEGYRQLRNAKIIDGPRLAKLLRNNVPEIARQLCGSSLDMASEIIIPQVINNDPLMRALDARTGRDLRTFYTDLDLAMGRMVNRLMFLADYEPRSVRFSITGAEWDDVKKAAQLLNKEFFVDPFRGTLTEIENKFLESQEESENQKRELKGIDSKLLIVGENLGKAEEEFRHENERMRSLDPRLSTLEADCAKLRASLSKLMNSRQPYESEIMALPQGTQTSKGDRDPRQVIILKPTTPEELNLDAMIASINRNIAKRLFGLNDFDLRVTKLREEKQKLSISRSHLSAKISTPKYEGTLDGRSISKGLVEKRRQLLAEIEDYNVNLPTPIRLREFFLRSEGTFQACAHLLRIPILREALGACVKEDLYSSPGARIKVPLNKIFETRMNIVLLGDAGAGKTTSLQNYAATKLENARPGEVALFAPLSRVIDCWRREEGELDNKASRRLESGLSLYFKSIGFYMDLSEFKVLLDRGGSVLLLDAVDEVIKNAPWIMSAIGSLASRYSKTQIIISSRTSVRRIDSLGFTILTLLPFTNSQREHFIRSWFNAAPSVASDVLHHLAEKRELEEIVRNPLLATILCVLREHGVPLPDNELRLYEERMSLLMGNYDIHKQVQRITSQRYFLRLVSQKLAFRLHCSVRRDATREELYEWTASALKGQLDYTDYRRLVDELVDPCNVLCSMTDDGRLGFGHLRYQEFLVAVELLQNRSIDLIDVARQPWWRGVLVLFSQMNSSIEWFVHELIDAKMLVAVKDLVFAMIDIRPLGERVRLKKIVSDNMYVEDNMFKIRQASMGFAEEFWEDDLKLEDLDGENDDSWNEDADG